MKNYLLVFVCLMSMTIKAQVPAEINLWPQSRLIDTANGHKLIEHGISKQGEELISGLPVIRLADITNPTIKIFTPKNASGTAVIVCPGGGYSILALDLEGSEI